MRKMIIMALMAATAATGVPSVASAQSAGEVRRSARDLREEQRDLRDAYRSGDRREIRDERRDVRDAAREYHGDRRDHAQARRDDWRGYRQRNRAIYARGRWNAPFRYQAFRTGVRLRPNYYASRYYINDPYRYRLPAAGRDTRWIRHYDDVLLVNIRTGRVLEVNRGFYW